MPKIAKSYRLHQSIVELIDSLVETSPSYSSATHLIEVLVYERALQAGIIGNGNGSEVHNDNGHPQQPFKLGQPVQCQHNGMVVVGTFLQYDSVRCPGGKSELWGSVYFNKVAIMKPIEQISPLETVE